MEINKIDDLDLKQHSSNIIISKRNSGKTKLVLNLIKYYFDKYNYDIIYLFSKTALFNKDWSFIDKKYISDLDENILQKIIKYQKNNITKNKNINIIIIFDDVKLTSISKSLSDLFSIGRHYNITILLSVQFPRLIVSPLIRSNIDYLFFSQLNNNTLHTIYESISTKSIWKNFNDFEDYCENNNDNYKFIFYNNMEHNKKDRIKIVKSILYKSIKMKHIKL